VCSRGFQLSPLPRWEDGGIDTNESERREFGDCILQCGLQEFKYVGAFFTWTNKQVWSRIDRALHNGLWFDLFDFTHVTTKPTVYQITLLLWLTFLFAQDQKRHLCSVICGPKMPNLLKLLSLS